MRNGVNWLGRNDERRYKRGGAHLVRSRPCRGSKVSDAWSMSRRFNQKFALKSLRQVQPRTMAGTLDWVALVTLAHRLCRIGDSARHCKRGLEESSEVSNQFSASVNTRHCNV